MLRSVSLRLRFLAMTGNGLAACLTKRLGGVPRLIGLFLLINLTLLKIADPVVMEVLRFRLFDALQSVAPREAAPAPIAIIDIDEKSLAALGQWPWPRHVMAQLVTRASEAGAVVTGFDMVFAEADRLTPAQLAQSLPGLTPQARAELAALPDTDAAFAEAMGKTRVVLGQSGRSDGGGQSPVSPQTPFAVIGGEPAAHLVTYSGVLENRPALEAAAAGRGLFSIRPEADGIVRRVPLVMQAGGRLNTALSLEMLRVATGGQAAAIRLDEAGIAQVVVAGVRIPTDSSGQLWLHYAPANAARRISAVDVIEGRIPPGRLTGHLVLVGTSAIGLNDLRATPLDRAMPGVEIHAQVIESILTKSWLTRPNYALGAEVVAGVLVGLVILVLVPILGAWPVLGLMLAMLAGVVSGGIWAFFTQRVLFDMLYPLLVGAGMFTTLVFLNFREEEKKRAGIRNAFQRYISPALVDQLAKSPDKLKLGGETRVMTFLFSDIRGFTTIAESFQKDPQGLTTLINRLLTPLSNAILDEFGTIDKYMGDAIMAFWNAPLDNAEHPFAACRAGLDMVRRLAVLEAERKAEAAVTGIKTPPLAVGVGINTGPCVVGNMGTVTRFDYSVLGDAVNLASRLEGQTVGYGVSIILGQNTAVAVENRYAVVEIDLLRVKGKKEPERIFALFGVEDVAADAAFMAAKSAVSDVITAYRARQFADVPKLIEAAMPLATPFRLGKVLEIHAARAAELLANPPPDDWDGAATAQSK